jgi:Sulfotransferase family
MLAAIDELEQQFDRTLDRPRVSAASATALSAASARWSDAVWRTAQLQGPMSLDPQQIARGFDVAQRPIFLCGVHRSGTTLLRDLLDHHPALAVLPSEGTFFTNLQPRLASIPSAERQSFLGGEWLRRLANPIHQHPYWLLGRSSPAYSPYVAYARALMAWWPLLEKCFGATVAAWPLLAVTMAYAQSIGALSATSQLTMWAEKTPTNEAFVARLRSEFPRAKFIHMIRHPYAVYASHRHAARQAQRRLHEAPRILDDLSRSYRIAERMSSGNPSADYRVLRYEDLIDNPSAEIARLAVFLGIEALPILTQPTAAGIPTVSNSSFASDAEAGRITRKPGEASNDRLTRGEREMLSAITAPAAARLGFELVPVSPWRARSLRLMATFSSRLG